MTRKQLRANFLMLLAAAIWGFAFVSQKVGMRYIGSFTFNGIRFAMGSIVLIPFILLFGKSRGRTIGMEAVRTARRRSLLAGIGGGVILCIAVNIQQMALNYTSVGSASFLTGMYVVVVPLLSLCFGKKIDKSIWLGVALAVIGIGLISITEDFRIGFGDAIVLGSTVFWALHILYIDRFNAEGDSLAFSSAQFATCAVLSIVCAVIFEEPTRAAIWDARWALAYAGFLSAGVAYTLQAVAQKDAIPAYAAIIMSMETVFGAIGGAILGERMPARGIVGCVLMFAAIILSQSPWKMKTEHRQ